MIWTEGNDVHTIQENALASEDPRPSKGEKVNQRSSEGPRKYLSLWRLAIVTFSLALATFLLAVDVYIVSIAVPEISAVFHSLDDVAWYGSAYLLTLTAFQPIMGYFYRYFDVRATYLISIAVFEGNIFGSDTLSKSALPSECDRIVDLY